MNENSIWDSLGNYIFAVLSALTVFCLMSVMLILSILFYQKYLQLTL